MSEEARGSTIERADHNERAGMHAYVSGEEE